MSDLVDFNVRDNTKQAISTTAVISDTLSLFIQELTIMFNTQKQDVFCDNKRGNEIEDALWRTSISTYSLKSLVNKMIQDGCLMNEYFTYTVDFDLIKGNLRDIGYLTIEIKTEDNTTERVTFEYS